MSVLEERVAGVRAFNRYWTNAIRLLRSGLLDTPYSLTEARIIFELAGAEELPTARLRALLDIDAGYLSRVMARFRSDGLVQARPAAEDRRCQLVALTARGREVFAELDARSRQEIRALLAPLTDEDQRRLLAAMATIHDLTSGAVSSPRAYVIRDPRPGELGWVVYRHGVLYDAEYGWDETFEALVARIVANYVDGRDHDREAAWVAELDGRPVGCVFCVAGERDTARLRLLLVEPRARGLGIGARLVEECVRFARRAGYRTLTLWTNDVLDSARRIYEAAGFALVDERPHHSFGHDLVGQNWSLDLGAGPNSGTVPDVRP